MDGDTRLVRNTNWWQTAAPIVDFAEVKLTLVEKTSEVRDNFEYENVNLVLTDPNSAAFAGVHNDHELWDARLPIMQYIGYNITSKVFSNYGLRSAITYAIDRDHLATDIMGGFAQPAVLPASPQAPFYDGKLANTYGYNLTKFSQQLESASVEDMDNDGTPDLELYIDEATSPCPTKLQIGKEEILSEETKGYIVGSPGVVHGRNWDDARDYLWPIPAAQRTLNPALTQNPGWDDGLNF